MIEVRLHAHFADLAGRQRVVVNPLLLFERGEPIRLRLLLLALVRDHPCLERYVSHNDEYVLRSNAMVVDDGGRLLCLDDPIEDGSVVDIMPAPLGG